MKRIQAALLFFISLGSGPAFAQGILNFWNPTTPDIGYGFAAQVDRFTASGAPNHSVLTVGAQINAVNRSGVNQIVFGIATEAWAEQGSFSMLTGLEATTINREPNNPWRKISLWSTFKNRPDTEYENPPYDPANLNSQGLRFESQIGTGFERAIVFAPESLHSSYKELSPIVIDFKEVPLEKMANWILIRYPDGWCKFYVGQGREENRPCPPK